MQTASPPSSRRLIHFSGRVQGVGFRYTVQNIALQFNIRGYVKNLPDGQVELVMEGAESEMNQIVCRISEKMNGFIKDTKTQSAPATGEFAHFAIRH
ncbi:MAG TPA: acylphosphatase [Tepidisphaeraceae bacterium]|jgi:acylphosphatase